MKTILLNQTKFPILSTWDPDFLDEILENLAKTANPSKTEIQEADKLWAATMLEMDLQSQSGTIWEENMQEDSQVTHNKMMFEKMKKEKIPWAEY
ncbi:MAG: hypothetical protein L6264_10270 [Weeksellaceae bacterium]|nr:hypothetical protein [Weeksellaceae bacterium]